jgi:hypothetical protein
VPWRYAVLSNMLLVFAAPPANAPSALAHVRHCVRLMRSDMLLLRQMAAAGLWMLLSPTAAETVRVRSGGAGQPAAAGGSMASDAVLQELKQVRCWMGVDRCWRVAAADCIP